MERVAFRLRMVDVPAGFGRPIVFSVGPRPISVGTAPENSVILRGRGISRHHAVLEVRAGALRILDRGSKNGSWIDGRRIAEGEAVAGAAVRLGELSWVVEAIDPRDVELGLEIEPPVPRPRGEQARTEELSRDAGDSPSSKWVVLLGAALSRARVSEPELADILRTLGDGLGARGALLARVRERGEPIVVSASGESSRIRSELWRASAPVVACLREAGRSGRGFETAILEMPEPMPVACAARALAGSGESLILVVFGSFPGSGRSAAVLAPVLDLAARTLRDATAPDALPAATAGLVFPNGYVVGESRASRDLLGELERVAGTDGNVLVEGETGTGKERIAEILHLSSPRRNGPFVTLNCAAIPGDLLEAEVFGVERGAATGVSARPGVLRRAARGTVFLDEIGELPPALQAKLLRAIETRSVSPVGGEPQAIDVRFVAATNRDLEAASRSGAFRADLYYRVAALVLRVPALRDRRDDIAALVADALARGARAAGRRVLGVSTLALEALVAYEWPGNVRELQNEMARLAAFCPEDGVIDFASLPERIRNAPRVSEFAAREEEPTDELEAHVARAERALIARVLAECGGNRTHAAKRLGVSRNGLAAKLARHGLANAADSEA